MSTAPSSPVAEGSVLIDAAALQSPATRVRGIGRYAAQWVVALEKLRPDLVGCYLLDPALAPPGILEPLSSSGKLRYRGDPAVAIDRYRLIHSLSPLDLEVPFAATWPGAAHRAGLARSATVYDLIPALDPDRELADPLVRLRYATRLGAVRSAEQLHVLSASVGRDLVQHLGMDPDRIVLVGAGPAADFSPASGPGDLALAAQLLGGLDRPFVLHPGGSHPRKNTEALLQAWALLPARTRTKHRLVLVGAVPSSTQNHYRHLARLGGFTENLVVLGEVTDDALRSCYRAAALVCFPSLAEGYGLPVVEAIACGTPVIASDIPPLDELLAPPARFDPSSAETIAGALRDALESPKRMTQIRDAARAPDDFAAVARRSAEAFDRLLAERRSRPRPRPRPLEAVRKPRRRLRIAFVSPFPPAPTGVAAYSHRLVEELLATGEVEVDVYLDGPTPAQVVPNGATGRGAASFLAAERLLGRYDRVCYSLGNSHHHLGALAALRERPGVVIAHDVRLSNCYRHEHGDPRGLRGGLGRAIQRLYPGGSLPEELGATDELSPADLERYGLLMASEAIGASQAFLVSSKAAAALARLDAGPTGAQKVRLLPFAVEAPGLDRSAYLDQPGEGDPLPAGVGTGAAPLIAHFGIVDPVKQPEVLLAATARLLPRHPGLRCAFVGPVSSQLADRLRDLAGSLGRPEVLVLAGPVGPESYLSALRRTTVAVQLRDGFNGEASAATGECLACGVPTVVTRSGWAKELPPDAVVALEAPVGTDELTATLDRLLSDGARRSSLSEAALRAAAGRSFAATARALLAELELAGPSPDDSGLDDSGLDEPGLDDSGLDDSGLDDSGLDDSGPGDSGPGDSALSEPA